MVAFRKISLCFVLILFALCLLLININAVAQAGQIARVTVHSISLEGNLLGDSPDRPVTIYLPPSYDVDPNRYYPVVYALHGYNGQNEWLMGGSYPIGGGNILDSMNTWIANGMSKEMIIVMPNADNKYGGSEYINSSVTGNWADFIARDLVDYIDSNYRTLPQPESRAVFGHSMGAFAILLGMLYPEVFSAIGGMGGSYDFEAIMSNNATQAGAAYIASLDESANFSSLAYPFQMLIAQMAAVSPNPDNPPFYIESPFAYANGKSGPVVKKQDIYDKIMELSPLHLVDKYLDDLLSMKAIYIDCGINDTNLADSRKLHEKLNDLGINHIYHEFQGGHITHVLQNTGKALGIFSDTLIFDIITMVSYNGKLTTAWGHVKHLAK